MNASNAVEGPTKLRARPRRCSPSLLITPSVLDVSLVQGTWSLPSTCSETLGVGSLHLCGMVL